MNHDFAHWSFPRNHKTISLRQLCRYNVTHIPVRGFLPRCMKCRRGLAMRILYVCLANAWIVTIGKKNLSIFYTIRKMILPSFLKRRMVHGSDSSTWNFESTGPRWSEIADFRSILSRRASAITPSEKSSITLIGSPLRAFQWAKDEHRTLSLSPPKGGSKCKVSKIWTISCDNSSMVRDRMSVNNNINH